MQGLKELGHGISIYFKLLKSLTIFLFFTAILCIPLATIYSFGEMKTSSGAQLLGMATLGNLGETVFQCAQQNMRVSNELTI